MEIFKERTKWFFDSMLIGKEGGGREGKGKELKVQTLEFVQNVSWREKI